MKNKRFKLAILSLCCCGGLFSQSLSQAQRWFNAGEFEKAKPVFRKLTKASPSNINYKFWYGACCYETGKLQEALPYLKKSAERKVINGYLYLSKAYYDMYRFDEAIENIEEHIYWLEKKKRNTQQAQSLLEKYRIGARMIRGVEKVLIVDSMIVDKAQFLDAYYLSSQAGKINFTGEGSCTSFENEMNDKILFSKVDSSQHKKLYSIVRLADKWTKPEAVSSLNATSDDLNYPFIDSDGITVYYSAKNEESMGGYDIFITRFDTENNTYLKPDNIGMPFNSPFNDYMYVIDDYRNLGWFASDRYQPEGKVCIYVFVPNEVKNVYDFDALDNDKLKSYAMLDNIKQTWFDSSKLTEAQKALQLSIQGEKKKHSSELYIVINDHITYHSLNEFKSKEASVKYMDMRMLQKDSAKIKQKLDQKRLLYAKASKTEKRNLAPGIIDMEKRLLEIQDEITRLEKDIRNIEIRAINKK